MVGCSRWFSSIGLLILEPFACCLPLHAIHKSRLTFLLEHCATTDDPRAVCLIAHPLAEILLVVWATIGECDDYDHIAVAWARRIWISCVVICPTLTACRRPLIDYPDESHQHGAVLGRLHGLCTRHLT